MKDYVDDNDVTRIREDDVPGVHSWYFIEVMGFCGCYSDDLFSDIMAVLRKFEKKPCLYYDAINLDGPDKYKEMILHVMTDKGLLEHGSSVRGSWLTERGKQVIKTIMDNEWGFLRNRNISSENCQQHRDAMADRLSIRGGRHIHHTQQI